jgi:hypothetical protein
MGEVPPGLLARIGARNSGAVVHMRERQAATATAYVKSRRMTTRGNPFRTDDVSETF